MAKRKPRKQSSTNSSGEVQVHLDEKSKKFFMIIGGIFGALLLILIALEVLN